MTETAATVDRRATNVVWLGLLVQIVATGTLIAVARSFESFAVAAAARFASIGILIWIALLLLFRQRRRVTAEQYESAELRRARASGEDSALFDIDAEDLLIERRKLEWLVKWMLPTVTLILSLAMIIGSFIAWGWDYSTVFDETVFRPQDRTTEPKLAMWFVGGVGLVCFWFARYAIGLARLREYRLIRAGAGMLTGCALVCLGVVLALGLTVRFTPAEPLVLYATRAMLFVLGIEFLGNFVADFYRPRIAGTISRPSFDSRLLGLVSEPGGIAKSIADAINYQFGFEVSKTWFYQLLKSAFLPLMVLTVVAMIGLSSILMVDADEQAIVERFGGPRMDGGQVKLLDPGIHLKLPWPIEIAYRAPVGRLNGILVGEDTADREDNGRRGAKEEKERPAILWTETHEFQAETMLLVAARDLADLSIHEDDSSPGEDAELTDRSVAVSVAMASIPVEYRINDLEAYLYNYADPIYMLESVANRVLTNNAASVDLETLMGPGREDFNKNLQEDIQAELDTLDVGIELVYCGMQSVHPPSQNNVAGTYQGVISAETGMRAAIDAAQGQAEATLTAVAGSKTRALVLDEAILTYEKLKNDVDADPQAVSASRQRVDDLIMGSPQAGIKPLSGTASAVIANARSRRAREVSKAHSKVAAFSSEVAAYEAAPALYRARKQLAAMEELDAIRKYLIVGDASRVIVIYEKVEPTQIDLSEPGTR